MMDAAQPDPKIPGQLPELETKSLPANNPAFLETQLGNTPEFDSTWSRTERTPPGYRIERKLGEGGMGVVYLAYENDTKRPVALKMISRGKDDNEQLLLRFELEAALIAGIRDPNVISIYGYGHHQGRPYLALEYCSGGSLADNPKFTLPTTIPTAAHTLLQVASGIASLHMQNITHRDIKPGNILVDGQGQLKVTDFGLAKREGGVDLTQTSAIMGTYAYMSPEQASGQARFVGPPSDVWSLGVMLYELIVGQRPFQGATPATLICAITDGDYVPLRKAKPDVPRDLAIICEKCLQLQPSERYPDAKELAGDLQRFLNQEPILARPITVFERTRRFIRRNKVLAFSFCMVFFTLLCSSIISIWFALQASAQATIAKKNEEEANQQKILASQREVEALNAAAAEQKQRQLAEQRSIDLARQKADTDKQLLRSEKLLYVNFLTNAQRAIEENRIELAFRLLQSCRWDYRAWEYDFLWTRLHRNRILFDGGTGAIRALALAPNNKTVLTAGEDRQIRQWNLKTGTIQASYLGHQAAITSLLFLPDGESFVSASEDHSICLWRIGEKEALGRFTGHTAAITHLAFIDQGKKLLSTSADRTVKVWDIATANAVATLKGHRDQIVSIAIHPTKNVAATASIDETIKIWDTTTGKLLQSINVLYPVTNVSYTQDGKKLISGNRRGMVQIWDLQEPTKPINLEGHIQPITALTVSPDNRLLVSVDQENRMIFWDIWEACQNRPSKRDEFFGRRNAVPRCLHFHPDAKQLFLGLSNGQLSILNVDQMDSLYRFTGHTSLVRSLAFSSNSKYLVSGSWDRSVRVWSVEKRQEIQQLRAHRGSVESVAYHPQEDFFASGSTDETIHLWQIGKDEPLQTLSGHQGAILALAYTPNGQQLISGSEDGTARIWDVKTGKLAHTLKGHTGYIQAVAISPDNQIVATASDDKTVILWKLVSGEKIQTIPAHSSGVNCVTFSRDGSMFITGSRDQTIKVWNLATMQAKMTLRGHTEAVTSVLLTADGRRLISVSQDDSLRIWELPTGQALLTLTGSDADLTALQFTGTQNGIATATGNDILFWPAQLQPQMFDMQESDEPIVRLMWGSEQTALFATHSSGKTTEWDLITGRIVGPESPSTAPLQEKRDQTPPGWASQFSGNALRIQNLLRTQQNHHTMLEELQRWEVADATYYRRNAARALQQKNWFTAIWNLKRLRIIIREDAWIEKQLQEAIREQQMPD